MPQHGVTMRVKGRTIARLRGQRVIDAILEAWAEGEDVEKKLHALIAQHGCAVTRSKFLRR
jgi:hypothetical protein